MQDQKPTLRDVADRLRLIQGTPAERAIMLAHLLGPRMAFREMLVGLELSSANQRFVRELPRGASGVLKIVGDSAGAGVGAPHPNLSFGGLLGAMAPSMTVRNVAVSGATVARTTHQVRIRRGRANVLIVCAGSNDVMQGVPIKHIGVALQFLVTHALEAADVVLITHGGSLRHAPIFLARTSEGYRETAASRVIAKRTAEIGDLYRRTAARYPDRLAFVDLVPFSERPAFRNAPGRYFARDGGHPNHLSYREAARLIDETLQARFGVNLRTHRF